MIFRSDQRGGQLSSASPENFPRLLRVQNLPKAMGCGKVASEIPPRKTKELGHVCGELCKARRICYEREAGHGQDLLGCW